MRKKQTSRVPPLSRARIQIAKPDIIELFAQSPTRIYRLSDLSAILEENRGFWRLAQRTTRTTFVEFLLEHTDFQVVRFEFPYRPQTRYVYGEVPAYELAISARMSACFSHYSAVYLHGLTEQIPSTNYINEEQSKKPQSSSELTQGRIDAALARKPRRTTNCCKFQGGQLCVISGKNTGQLGVVEHTSVAGANLRVTNIERTLIDIAVRPFYAGGVFEVLKAYRLAHGQFSVNRLAAMLRKLDYVYPYHQVIGFYLDRAGVYRDAQIRTVAKQEKEFDFYLTYAMGKTSYDEKWRLFHPAGF